jgi:hypothetical protein
MNLEQLLIQLVGFTAEAQARWLVQVRDELEDEDHILDGDLFLGLQINHDGTWSCGWLLQEDEPTEYTIVAEAATPLAAAQALLAKIQA